jgi:hypothetical protein
MAIATATPRAAASTVPVSTRVAVKLGLLLVGAGIAIAAFQKINVPDTSPSTASPFASEAHSAFALPDFSHVIQNAGLLVAAVSVAGFLALARGRRRF